MIRPNVNNIEEFTTEFLIINESKIDWDYLSRLKTRKFSLPEIRMFRYLINWDNYCLYHQLNDIEFITASKYFTDVNSVDTIIALDEEVRKLKVETETIQAAVNLASKEIGMLMAKGEKDTAEIKKQEVAQQKSSQQNLTTQLSNAEKQLHDELVKLPNLPHSSVPKGKTPEENEVVKEEKKVHLSKPKDEAEKGGDE